MAKSDFTLLSTKHIKEVDGVASLWQHNITHAQLLSIVNHDENKCFGVNFRTPPANSTGVAHIMEHSVLCGSDKYPVKEPFVELLKGSLHTFLNAFTFPDKTCYPVASANLQDFYNLIAVYIDAAFHPLISEQIFKQEGWHLEALTPDANWSYKGVVYNEMKGSYSSPESVLAEQSQRTVFPDMLYSYDSGGDPDHIIELTYEDFLNFHKSYYHPSNARFFFWGDDPEEKRFEIVANALVGYSFKEVHSEIPLQIPFSTPRLKEVAYAAASKDQKAMFTMNWLLGERGDVKEALRMEMLAHILEGLPGSPLRRALIESGLGEDLAGVGLETELRQMYYSVGLKGIAQADVQRAETLIFDTLAKLSEGIDPKLVEAAVNSVEFQYRERNTGMFPQGLVAMVQALSTWLYDGDPMAVLAFEEPLADIKASLQQGEPVFEDLLRKRFINNAHRSTVVLVPDLNLAKERDALMAKNISQIIASKSQSERAKLVQETISLQEAQLKPDSQEDLAKIPMLTISDLPLENKKIEQTKVQGNFLTLAHAQPTQGIAYAQLLVPINNLQAKHLQLLPLFLRSLTEIGTKRHDFVSFGAEMAAKTGGIQASIVAGGNISTHKPFYYFAIGGKAVYDKIDPLFDLVHEALFEPLEDRNIAIQRLGQMLLETRARLEQQVVAHGHGVVGSRLGARYGQVQTLAEMTSGFSYLEAIRKQIADFTANPEQLLSELEQIRKAIFVNQGVIFSCTAEDAMLTQLNDKAKTIYNDLPSSSLNAGMDLAVMAKLPNREALIIPSRINFIGKSCDLYAHGWQYHGSASVILRYLRMGYLWEQVRVRGGAYGAFCSFDRINGILKCISFRDPNQSETLKAYDQMSDFLANFTPDNSQLTQAIVGAVGDLDTYLLPSDKGSAALMRYLTGDTDELRQQMRDEMLATKASDFKDFADKVAYLKDGDICILGGQDVCDYAKAQNYDIKHVF